MSIITKTATQHVEEVKQEFLKADAKLWNNSMIAELKQEYYDVIINNLNNGGKITQAVYDEMTQDKSYMFEYFLNKNFLAQGINIIAKGGIKQYYQRN